MTSTKCVLVRLGKAGWCSHLGPMAKMSSSSTCEEMRANKIGNRTSEQHGPRRFSSWSNAGKNSVHYVQTTVGIQQRMMVCMCVWLWVSFVKRQGSCPSGSTNTFRWFHHMCEFGFCPIFLSSPGHLPYDWPHSGCWCTSTCIHQVCMHQAWQLSVYEYSPHGVFVKSRIIAI
jgi:hypothetical protein